MVTVAQAPNRQKTNHYKPLYEAFSFRISIEKSIFDALTKLKTGFERHFSTSR